MAKKKQRINLIDRNGNSQVVQVNSSDLSDSTKSNKKTSIGSTIKNATSGGITKKFVTVRPSGGTNEQNERNYGALVNASNTNTVTPTIRTSDINANLDKKENQRLANRQYNEALSNTLEARNDLSKKAFNEMKEQGAETDNRNLLSQDKRQLSYETKNKGKTAKDIIEENNEKIAKASENTKEKYQKEIKDLANKENELTYAKYQKDYWDVQNDDIDTVDKTLGIVPNAIADYFSSFTRDQQTYTDKNGNELVLPTKSEMKREKTLENIKNPVGRWLYQVGHEGTKQAITEGLNMSGLPLGSALYYGDILTDTYNENLNSGENKTRSIIDAVAKTGQSYIKQKILGGIGGKLTGNNSPSWLEKTLSKKFGEFIENPAVTTLLGSATAEGIDEFTDSYIEKALDAAILSDNKEEALKRIKEVFSVDALKEAFYEGSIGMGTGAIGNIDEAIDASKTNRFLKKNGIDIKQARQIAQTQTAEDIQKSAADGTNEVMNQVQQGNITEQQGQQFLDTIQRRTQAILDLQQSMQGNQQNTIESKMEIVQNLNDVEKSRLVEVTQKMKSGQQLDIDDIATLDYLNSKGTPQAVENAPISNETTQPNAIPQEEQNVAQNREINNNYASQDLEGPPVEEVQTPYSKQMTQEEADEMQRAHSESLDRMADGRVGRTPGEQLIKDNNVSDRRVNAIQYDNPEVKKYYRDAAEIVGAEADMAKENAFKSGIREQQDELGRTEYRRYAGWNGFISKDLSDLARNNHLTAKQIEKAADDIIEDNGKENNANAKKLEKILDKRLREGYSAFGDNFEPNQDYINEIESIAYEKQRQGELESLEEGSKPVETNETTQNNNENKQESTEDSSFNLKQKQNETTPEETFRNIKTKEDMDNLISNLKDKVDNIKTGEDLKNTFKEIYDIYKVYNKSNDIYEIVEKDGLYGTRFESEFYNPDIKYKPLNEEIKIQKDNLESWLKIIKDDSEKIIYDNQDKITPTIGKNIDSIDKVTPITTDDFKNKLHDYIDKETEDIKGKFESKDGHLFRGGKEVRYLYRAIDQAEMDSIKNNGYIKSNQSKNIGYEVEQGLTDFKDGYPGFYLPRNADGYIIKIEVKPENGFFYDSDEYAKTPNEIPANQIVEINGEKINTQRETNQNKNIPDKVEDNVITIKNDDLKDIPKDQIKTEDTGIKIGDKPVKMEIPIDSKQNKIGQYVPKDGFTQKELKDGKIGDSKFYRNVTERADFINDEVRKTVKDDDNIKHYRKVTNEESMQEAFDDLNTRGTEAIAEFFNNDKELTSKDTAMGWLLIEQSQANGDYNFANQVLRKMRDNATKTGQTMQMYNYYARLTPEGMYKWCGDQLLRAEEIFEKGKTKKWIEQNKDRWQLNGEEVEFINKQMERVQELNKMNDNDKTTIEIGKKKKEVTVDRAKQVEIAKIQSMIENKIPPQKGQALNAWMRISMLGNLKTIATRNPLGNIALRPINDIGDFTSSLVDYAISKKTGVRTKGNFNPLAQAKGMARGATETIQDARLGINTRDAKGNRFEIGQGKSFNEHHKGVAKVLNPFAKLGNKADSAVSFLLDLGDRPFYEATYQQSLENQMKLNKIDKLEDVPQWMKSIAEQEALERTYQDDNNYTSAVIDIRRAMNKMVNVKGYGLGDVIIPFAKTPANLTKAIVDYSPAGFVNALTKGKELRRSIQNGQFTPEIQHAFVNQLGKAMAGTMLYGIGAALANSGIITGGADEDKDVADFMRNTLGIQPYSVVIGDKSFTYDWAQPVASALAIPADIKQGIQDAKEGEADLQYIIHKAFSTSGNILLEQSFLQGIKEVLGGYGDPLDNLMSEIEGLPARAVPTLFQQIVTYFDPTKRMSYGNKGIQNVISQAQAKTPWASDLPKYRNSMGKEIQMYGGKNSFFNVFLNPANYSEGNATESAEEIYRVYQATNKKEILPRLVDNSIKNEDGTKLTNEQKSEWLRISGGIIDREVERLTKNGNYLRMSDEDKADTIKAIVDYAYNEARNRVTGHELSSADRKANNAEASGYALADYFLTKTTNKVEKTQKTNTRNRYMEAKEKGIDGKTFDDFHAFVASARGESRTGGKTKKQKIIDYIQGLPLTREQKEALYNDYLENNGIISYYN